MYSIALLSQLVEEMVLEAMKSRFESERGYHKYLPVVQGIEQQPSKLWVGGSNPSGQAKQEFKLNRKTNRYLIANQEPKFEDPLSKIDLIRALNWYVQNKDTKDVQKYALEFFKKKHKVDITPILKEMNFTIGSICRIVSNGAVLPKESEKSFNATINSIKTSLTNVKVVKQQKEKPVVNIQDRIAEKVNEVIGELEGSIDDYIISDFNKSPSPFAIMQGKVKSVYVSKITDVFKKRRIEFDTALNTKDAYVKESYSNFTKMQLKKLIAYCDQIIADCNKIGEVKISTRKPRKKKQKTVDEIVKLVNYCKEIPEMKIVSEHPKNIVGSNQVWIYNVKTRKLGCYFANDVDGLNVKGTSIINFSEQKSVQKTLRKPETFLNEVLKGGKVFLRNALSNIRAVESKMNGRINKDTIILRSIK
jgi:hypothetical protein